jgi:hypothetical protein
MLKTYVYTNPETRGKEYKSANSIKNLLLKLKDSAMLNTTTMTQNKKMLFKLTSLL